MKSTSRHRQSGAVLLTVALLLLFLLGFMGIALDLGRVFIVKTELQTAMDSCALSAAHELDGLPDALTRADSAGLTAGNVNRVNLQSGDWSGQGQLTTADITYRDSNFSVTTNPAAAKYAECIHSQPNIQMWLLHIMASLSPDPAAFASTSTVVARAVATRGSTQTTCPIPVALRPKTDPPSCSSPPCSPCANGDCSAPNYGYAVGEWVTLLMEQAAAGGGEIGWANLDGSNNAAETRNEMLGSCGTRVGDTLGTPGVQTTIAEVWNFRFGIYKTNGDPAVNRPDMTGYSYTSANWPSRFNAYDDFVTKRQNFASCIDQNPATGQQAITACETILGEGRRLNSFAKLAAPGPTATGGHREYGISRRVVLVPVINPANNVIDYACMLMLQPLSIPMGNVQLEFRGNASAPNSPCTTAGLPGGVAGPLVPVLVR